MKLRTKLFEIFQSQFPDLVDKIEKEVYLFLEELILQKNILIDKEIDYKDPDFREVLHSVVDIIGNGLSMIGIPKDQIESSFKSEYRFFKTQMNLKTYKSWIYDEFKPKLEYLLFGEILNFFIDPTRNIINKMLDLGLIDESIKVKFEEIYQKYPRLNKFLSWQINIENILKKELFEKQIIQTILKFEDPENDLRAVYFLYLLGEFFKFNNRINLSSAVSFLIGDISKWSLPNKEISLVKPLTLYSGLYLTIKNDIELDLTIVKNNLKDLLVESINLHEDPIFSDSYIVYYIINSMKLLKLKLTPKFIESLIKKKTDSTTIDKLSQLTTDRLGLIYELFKELEFLNVLTNEDRENIKHIIEKRQIEGLYCSSELNRECGIESIWGAINFFLDIKSLEGVDIAFCIDFLIDQFIEIQNKLNIRDPEQLGKLYLGINILEKIDSTYDVKIINALEEYIFSSITRGKNNIKMTPSVEDQDNLHVESNDSSIISSEKRSVHEISNNTSEKIDIKSSIKVDIDNLEELGIDNLSLSNQNQSKTIQTSVKSIQDTIKSDEPLPNEGNALIQYFIDCPSLSLDLLQQINLNYEAIVKPADIIMESLESLYKLVVIEKILRLKHYFDESKIDKICKKFWRKNGFGETSISDVINTFYGLFIYHEYNLLDEIDIYAIHEFLLEEMKFFKPYKFINNAYLLLSLKILDSHGLKLMTYEAVKEKILNLNVSLYEDFDPLKDSFYLIILLKILSPSLKNYKIKEDFVRSLKIEIDQDGSINGNISDTAIALYSLGLMDLLDEEYELASKLKNFILNKSKFFDSELEDQHISWGNDIIGLDLEFNYCFWGLLGLMAFKPFKSIQPNPNICPDCGKFFVKLPKFCNQCGHKFIK